ncbi:MAG: serine hydrolase domain-containing protein [Gammaproteobacteria bacterium]|nr:serine hydrolase domain-containing protein [Gammaproteobacteria bacterium]HJO10412.1 serine hydrolase domain-containing protein [Gammaproteobacteria bacterium]|tara:strand:- start:1715 stop:3016 length:1302 start_codon:yes stop_codon:yes gene_type:complete
MRISIRNLLAVALVLLIPATQGLAQVPMAEPESVGMSSERLQRLDASMQELIDQDRTAGVVTLVARDGKIVHLSALGDRYREAGAAMGVDNIFFIQSMTKSVVSTALMMLYEEGEFQLSDPVTNYLPEIAEKMVVRRTTNGVVRERPARPITFRDVLSHTSGVDPDRELLTPEQQALLGRRSTLSETISDWAKLPLGFSPGDRWDYGSSTDYVAHLVERISGQRLDLFLQERIFEPLGMEETWYNVPAEYTDRIAALYRPSDGFGSPLELAIEPGSVGPTQYFGGVNGLYSTATDYFRFAQMILNGGEFNGERLISPTTVNLMISNHVQDLPVRSCVGGRDNGYGFGLSFVMITDVGQTRESLTPGSFGWCGAWNTVYWIDPTERTVMILMEQLSGAGGSDIRRLFPNLVMQAITESYHSAPGSIDAYSPRAR